MKVCKTIAIFILLFTGYLCIADDAFLTTEMPPLVDHTKPAKGLSPPLEDHTLPLEYHTPTLENPTQDSASGTPRSNNSAPAERHLSSMVVAGISISLVILFAIIITGVWYAWQNSREISAEFNSALSTEPGVSLRGISMTENQP